MSQSTPPARRMISHVEPLLSHIQWHRLDSINRILESDRWAACTFAESPDGSVLLPLVAAIQCKAPLQIIDLLLWHGATVTKEVIAAASSGYSCSKEHAASACDLRFDQYMNGQLTPNDVLSIDWSALGRWSALCYMKEQDAWQELQHAYIRRLEAAVVDLRTYRCLSVAWTRSVANKDFSVNAKLNLLNVDSQIRGLVCEFVGPCRFDRM